MLIPLTVGMKVRWKRRVGGLHGYGAQRRYRTVPAVVERLGPTNCRVRVGGPGAGSYTAPRSSLLPASASWWHRNGDPDLSPTGADGSDEGAPT